MEVKGSFMDEQKMVLYVSDESEPLTLNSNDLSESFVREHTPSQFRLMAAAVSIALERLQQEGTPAVQGMIVRNSSQRVKGMGSSSAFAACVIALIYQMYSNSDMPFDAFVKAAIQAESVSGIGGGWEDVAGIYGPGINHIVRHEATTPEFEIRNIPMAVVPNGLNDQLLIFDSHIPASTTQILESAYQIYLRDPRLTETCSREIQNECERVETALSDNDMRALGESLLRQRALWRRITGGTSECSSITAAMESLVDSIWGYREAGAGGGGTVLVMCRENAGHIVIQSLEQMGYTWHPWQVSPSGISVAEHS